MDCILCFGTDSEPINLASAESAVNCIPDTLHKYFCFYFPIPPYVGTICRRCWSKVCEFHAFCNQIEATRNEYQILTDRSNETLEQEVVNPTETSNILLGIDNRDLDSVGVWRTKCEILSSNTCRKHADEIQSDSLKRKWKSRRPEDEGSYRCEVCDIYFFTDWKLNYHMKSNHLALPYKCTAARCAESFETTESLEEHTRRMHPQTKCPHCSKFILMSKLERHIRVEHQMKESVVCHICGKISKTLGYHQEHYRWNHNMLKEKLMCDICGTLTKNKHTMARHMLTQHIGQPQKCDICDKILSNRYTLTQHKRHHKGTAKKHECKVCGLSFGRPSKLKEHSFKHTGQTDTFACNFCGRTYKYRASLYLHRRNAHKKVI